MRPRVRWLARLAALAVLALSALGPPAHGEAHGIVLESTPPQDQTVSAPKRLVIRFNSRLEKRLCSVTLVGPDGKSVLLLKQDSDAGADTLSYPLPELKPGPYRARWKVLAADGHVTEGAIAFTVQAAAAQ